METRPEAKSRTPTVLVSDDEPAIRRSLHLLLRARGYNVSGYTSGTALLSDPNALSADCAILDYRMPDVDGFTILERLRSRGWQGAAILISGVPDDDLARKARAAGFAEFLAKPLLGRAVLDAVACQCAPCNCSRSRRRATKASTGPS